MAMLDHFRHSLDRIAAKNRIRTLQDSELRDGGRVARGGRELVDLSSNDYLGLARHPLLAQTAANHARLYGAGSGASRLITGSTARHVQVEERIAAFKHSEAALLMASGWQANAGIIPAIAKAAPTTAIFADERVHNSIHSGCRAAQAEVHFFAHNDAADLDRLLASRGAAADLRIVITESVFSMDGDRAPLAALCDTARRHDAFLYLDEAHATGVLGPGGAGLAAEMAHPADLVMGTFSKAMGGFGAYVACSALLRDYLVNMAPGLIFSAALPPAVLGTMAAALELVPVMEDERAHLAALADRLRAGLQAQGFDTLGSTTQIVPVVIGSESDALACARHLKDHGIAALPIRPPTVPTGTSRIRLALRSTLSADDVDQVVAAFGEWSRR